MIPGVDNGQERCDANVKESADVPKQSTARFDITRILNNAPYLHSLIISPCHPPAVSKQAAAYSGAMQKKGPQDGATSAEFVRSGDPLGLDEEAVLKVGVSRVEWLTVSSVKSC
jgi:hypothetical protein